MARSRQKDTEPPCRSVEESMNNLASHSQSRSETQELMSSSDKKIIILSVVSKL